MTPKIISLHAFLTEKYKHWYKKMARVNVFQKKKKKTGKKSYSDMHRVENIARRFLSEERNF